MTTVVKSQGTTFEVKSAAGAWIAIGQVKGSSGPGGQAAVIDVSHLKSTRKEKVMGLPDEGQFTFNVIYDPANAGQLRCRALRAASEEGDFRITLTDVGNEVQSFSGFVLGMPQETPEDNIVQAAITVEISGEVTYA